VRQGLDCSTGRIVETHKERFPFSRKTAALVLHSFFVTAHNAFITSQSLCVRANEMLKGTFCIVRKCQPYSKVNFVYPNVQTLIKLMLITTCTTASVERSLSIFDRR